MLNSRAYFGTSEMFNGKPIRMSKLERLNTRVAKLLTDVVQEILEMVKETVSEYQEKAARTQRENETLKRRLEKLQTKESKSVLCVTGQFLEENEDTESQEQEFDLPLWQNLQLDLTEKNDSNEQRWDHELPQKSAKQESCSDTDEPAECDLAQTSTEQHCKEQAEDVSHINEDGTPMHVSHNAARDDAALADTSLPSVPHGVNTTVVKRELDCATPEPQSLQEHYTASVDLNYHSSGSQRPQVNAESLGLVFARSNHTLSRRHGFVKTNRGTFDGRKIMMEHFSREDSHLCLVCGKTFSRVGNLKIHQRCHTGEKPYGCVQCGRRFTQAGDLKKHKRVHTGEKPYYCTQCGKSFSRGENLKRHQKIHIGETLTFQHV